VLQPYRQLAQAYLSRHGYSGKKLAEILGGFDFDLPVYEQGLESGSILYQFVRRASFGVPLPRIGNWFCLPGASLGSLAIISGGEGRLVTKVRVRFFLVALEGTAARQLRQWGWSGGGPGGATQIFIPKAFLVTHLDVLGSHTDLRNVAGA
jgi:hypothetical protein